MLNLGLNKFEQVCTGLNRFERGEFGSLSSSLTQLRFLNYLRILIKEHEDDYFKNLIRDIHVLFLHSTLNP